MNHAQYAESIVRNRKRKNAAKKVDIFWCDDDGEGVVLLWKPLRSSRSWPRQKPMTTEDVAKGNAFANKTAKEAAKGQHGSFLHENKQKHHLIDFKRHAEQCSRLRKNNVEN